MVLPINQIYKQESYLHKDPPGYKFKKIEVDILEADDDRLINLSKNGQLYLTLDEMKRIQADLMQFYPIAKLARETCAQFTAELLAQDIAAKIAEDANSFYKLHSGEKFVEFRADHCVAHEDKQVELVGEVVVVEFGAASKEHLSTMHAARAFLVIEGDELAPTLTMDIYNAQIEDTGYVKMRHIIRGLIPPETVRSKFRAGKILDDISPEAISLALSEGPSKELRILQRRLQREIQKMYVLVDIS